MPLITRADVLAYTTIPKVIARAEKLDNDILRAEMKVVSICKHDFTAIDPVTLLPVYETIPQTVKLATILWSEYFALKEIGKESEGFKSESLEGYSYTRANNTSVTEPDTYLLLKDYILETSAGSKSPVILKMRAI